MVFYQPVAACSDPTVTTLSVYSAASYFSGVHYPCRVAPWSDRRQISILPPDCKGVAITMLTSMIYFAFGDYYCLPGSKSLIIGK